MLNRLFGRACLIASAICLSTLASCSDDAPDGDGGGSASSSTLKLDRLDVSDARALTLVGTPSKSRAATEQSALFKMDQDGNLSAVVLHVTEDAGGNKITERTDITVHPRSIFSLCGKYTYLVHCRFFDSKGEGVWFTSYDGDGVYNFNILVANNTGKIYYVPVAAHEHFPRYDNDSRKSAVDKDGNLYLGYSGNVAKMTISGEKAEIATYGPEGFADGSMHVLDNGVVVFQPVGCALKVLYPNGGFEYLSGASEDRRENDSHGTLQTDRYSYSFIDHQVYAVKAPKENYMYEWYEEEPYETGERYINEQVSLSIVKVNIGTIFGNISYCEPLATITGTDTPLKFSERGNDWTWERTSWVHFARDGSYDGGPRCGSAWASNRYMFIGDILAYDKNSGEWTDLVACGIKKHVAPLNADNTYKGRAWTIYADVAYWFNPETLETGEVTMPEIMRTGEIVEHDIPSGKLYYTALSNFDGSKHLYTIDIETGNYAVADIPTEQQIITLVPLN